MSSRVKHFSLLFFLLLTSFSSLASRQVTDQLGREVTIPDQVDRVVVLQHQTLNLLVQLDATQTMVGILSNWKQQLGDNYQRLVPALNSIPLLGDLTHVDLEKLVALHPQVPAEINNSKQWQAIDAVKNHRVYLMPEYAKAWGYPMPEAIGLGELWMAKKLYPQRFADIDMQKLAQQWYQRFYRSNYQGFN